MTEEQLGPGKDVLSYCGKCKLALNHVIIDMKSPTVIGKCQCLTCKAKHLYRDPDKPVKKRASTKKAATVPVEQVWAEAVNGANGPAKSYSIKDTFEAVSYTHLTLPTIRLV